MPNKPAHLKVQESFVFAQHATLDFELAMAGTGTLRAVLLAVKPDGDPLAIITSTRAHSLARITRVDQRLLRIIFYWSNWIEQPAVLHLLCAPSDDLDSFSRMSELSLAHYSRPTSLHYQPPLQEYVGWRSLHLASWRIIEGQPQIKALVHPYGHELPAAARDFGFSAAEVTAALVLPRTIPRRSHQANITIQTALHESQLPLSAGSITDYAAPTPPVVELTRQKYDRHQQLSDKHAHMLPKIQAERATETPAIHSIPFFARSETDDILMQDLQALLMAWQQAVPELPEETWEIWQQHFPLGMYQIDDINGVQAERRWHQHLQEQPWLLAMIRQHTIQLFSPAARDKALGWLNRQFQ